MLTLYILSDQVFEVHGQLSAIDKQGRTIQQTIRDSHTTMIESNTAIQFTVIEHNTAMQSAMIEHNTEVQTKIRDAITKFEAEICTNTEAINTAQSGATAQGDMMMVMLSQMMEHLTQLSLKHKSSARMQEVQDDAQLIDEMPVDNVPVDETPADEILPYGVLEDSINSILVALHDKQGIFSLEEARDIVEPLAALLNVMVSDMFLASMETSTSTYERWCETCTKEDLARLRKSLVTLQGMALSAQKFTVNERGTKTRPMMGIVEGGTVLHAQVRSCDLAIGSFSILTFERLRHRQQWRQRRHVRPLRAILGSAHKSAESADATIDVDREIRIRYFSRPGQPRQGFQAIMRQSSGDRGTFNSIPKLFTYNILPKSSPVFTLVYEGRMAEFQEMLRSGTASLRDQDEFGASLLMVRYWQSDTRSPVRNKHGLLTGLFSTRSFNQKYVATYSSKEQT